MSNIYKNVIELIGKTPLVEVMYAISRLPFRNWHV